jgi:molecular chaperone Hsp33
MDIISRIYCKDLSLRAYTVTSKSTTQKIVTAHNTTPNATMALGRSINAAALLGATLKPLSNQNILLKFSGSGPIKEIHVQADAKGNIRGYVANPHVDITEKFDTISFSKSIGAGLLTVIKDVGMKEPYSSVTPLLYGEVASDLAYYLTTSEQVPSAVILGLNLDSNGGIASSGGILIQTFPDTPAEAIEKIEANINSMATPLGTLLEEGADIYSVLSELFDNRGMEILSTTPLKYSCSCSRETLLQIFKGINKDELKDMIERDKGAEVTCTFCRKNYRFSESELKSII